MELKHIKMIEDVCDKMDELFKKLDKAGEFTKIKKLLEQAAGKLPEGQDIALNWAIKLSEPESDKPPIKYYDMGLVAPSKEEPYFFEGVSSLRTYIFKGDVIRVPNDICPNCWKDWDFKFRNNECECCGIVLGKELKILLDDDVCPFCEEGCVSVANPECDECDFVVDLNKILWG